MSPPPLTPAPRRFLLPSTKRNLGTSTQTPASSSSARPQPSQFHSTPKFAPSSTPWSGRKATQDVEEVDEVLDEDEDEQGEGSSSSFGESEQDETGDGVSAKAEKDDIDEADNDTTSDDGIERDMQRSHESVSLMDQGTWKEDERIARRDGIDDPKTHHVLHSPKERVYKRRRVSLSPDIKSESLPSDHGHGGAHVGGNVAGHVTQLITGDLNDEGPSPLPEQIEGGYDSHDNDSQDSDSSPNHAQASRALNQPTFLAAPRFRAPSPSSAPAEILPTAFSPQRRGQQFLAGGMAATLQTQLSEIKSWDGPSGSMPPQARASPDGESAPEEWMLQVVEVRAGRRMYLVLGHATAGEARQENQRVILAGEGTLTGMGRRAAVSDGSRVRVRQPVWEAVIEGETWFVACDWSMLS